MPAPPRPHRWAGAAALAVLLALGALRLIGAGPPSAFRGTTYEEISPAPDFALVDQRGRPVTRDSLAGTPSLLFFGYTRCPDVCPLTLTRLRAAVREAGARGVRIVLVTVDPRHDTPAVLARYLEGFGPGVMGLTGDSAAVAHAMAGYGAYTLPPAPHGAHGGGGRRAELAHTAVVYGLDRAGNLRVVIPEGARPEDLRHDVRALARR